jgi:mannose-6-phosphate isomerase-like protein (cupin superfamily)
MRMLLRAAIVGVGLCTAVAAQQPKPPATPPAAPPTTAPKPPQPSAAPKPPQPSARPRATQTATSVIVRDHDGSPIADVKVIATGPSNQQATTGRDGTATLSALRDGSYRLRFERQDFNTFEREVTIRGRQTDPIEVWLSAAPPPPPPPEPPPPAPAPAPAPPPPAPSSVAAAPSGPPTFVSIPEFLDKNYIGGREPLKESVLGCLADSTTRLLQLHDGLAAHAHADLDEMLYVVAGEGTVKVEGQSKMVAAGSLTIIPHGQAHAIDRRGKNPLMLLSVLSGAPCRAGQPGASPTPAGTAGAQKK